jgi:aryl-alcohol dehydrogenase-like predicted oxidoreductase
MGELARATLGRTGVSVTRLGFGAMGLAGAGGTRSRGLSAGQAARLLHAVLDAGIDVIDTSPDYGDSEELIGASLADRRDTYFLASKCGCAVNQPPPQPGQPRPHIYTRENVRAGVEQSLTRMRTDHLDLVQIHMSPARSVVEEADLIAELDALRDQGKLRFIGISATLPNLVDHIEMGVFDTFQIPYSLLEPEHDAWITAAAHAGAGTIVRGGVARGVMATPTLDVEGQTEPSRKSLTRKWTLWQTARLAELLDGASEAEFMVRATLAHDDLHTTIVGATSIEHLHANVTAASKGPLPVDVYREAKHRIAVVDDRPTQRSGRP